MAEESTLGQLPKTNKTTEPSNMDSKSAWRRWFGKSEPLAPPSNIQDEALQRPGVARRLSRKVIPGLPRPGTFRRQQSELRDNLEPSISTHLEARTRSVDPRRRSPGRAPSNTPKLTSPRVSAPGNLGTIFSNSEIPNIAAFPVLSVNQKDSSQVSEEMTGPSPTDHDESTPCEDTKSTSADEFDDDLLEELEKCWILNLSMHFRDRSNREKFFVTYAATPSHWRRVTISLDYRDACAGSLELELQQMQFQRDKSARIYESIRDSLPDIQFYDTVTNLKLQTENDRLHVHVTEDVHEVINYPPISSISHLTCEKYREEELTFDSHLSGFVYKVTTNTDQEERVFIKKEIPGPDTVEEFLYEINALHHLSGSESVIHFGGVVVDNERKVLKGLLISYAAQGALIDVIYDGKKQIPWSKRERWAKQIVQGLSEIHEAGFVQGDFTLSNIVVDEKDDAKIIDINRRGCPVGWEPPEIVDLLKSKQRISMFIGIKTDLFQLGMVLWALAMQLDEPELEERPLKLDEAPSDIPRYYKAMVSICLSDNPRYRQQATTLLNMFPADIDLDHSLHHREASVEENLETQFIDPSAAVERDDIDNSRLLEPQPHGTSPAIEARSTGTHTYIQAPTDFSGEPYYCPRGRSPPPRSRESSVHRGIKTTDHQQDPDPWATKESNGPDSVRNADSNSRVSRTASITRSRDLSQGNILSDPIDTTSTSFANQQAFANSPRETESTDMAALSGDLIGMDLGLNSTELPRYPQVVVDDDLMTEP